MEAIIFETLGIVAGICIAVPALPQIWNTWKSKNVESLSPSMFWLLLIGCACYWLYGRHLGSVSMLIFNAISVICSSIMLILIKKYKKR